MKRKVVIVGLYLPGIYPRGEDDVVADLLAPAYMKAVVDADPALSRAYDVKVLNLPTTTSKEEIVERICREKPYLAAFSVYICLKEVNSRQFNQILFVNKNKNCSRHIIALPRSAALIVRGEHSFMGVFNHIGFGNREIKDLNGSPDIHKSLKFRIV